MKTLVETGISAFSTKNDITEVSLTFSMNSSDNDRPTNVPILDEQEIASSSEQELASSIQCSINIEYEQELTDSSSSNLDVSTVSNSNVPESLESCFSVEDGVVNKPMQTLLEELLEHTFSLYRNFDHVLNEDIEWFLHLVNRTFHPAVENENCFFEICYKCININICKFYLTRIMKRSHTSNSILNQETHGLQICTLQVSILKSLKFNCYDV